MADLYVLEGWGTSIHAKKPKMHRRNRHVTRNRHVPGIVYGNPIELLGFSLNPMKAVRAVSHVVANTGRAAAKVTSSAAGVVNRNVIRPVAHDVAQTARFTQHDILRPAAHGVMVAERATVDALNVLRRVTKRLIRSVAKKVLFHGDFLGASAVAAVPKNAAKGILIPAATAAVIANTVTAPAAPIVPILVNEVIDELYNNISDAVSKGLSPDKAAKSAQDGLDKLEPGEENDPKVSAGSFMPVAIGIAAVLGLVVILKKKRS